MAQYINKTDVVAEIKKRVADNKKEIERASHKNLEDYFEGYEDALVLLKEQVLDTLEVKEIDFETSFAASIDHFDEKNNYGRWSESDLRDFAKHFFELGLKTKEK